MRAAALLQHSLNAPMAVLGILPFHLVDQPPFLDR
jgi:hypothetical protein